MTELEQVESEEQRFFFNGQPGTFLRYLTDLRAGRRAGVAEAWVWMRCGWGVDAGVDGGPFSVSGRQSEFLGTVRTFKGAEIGTQTPHTHSKVEENSQQKTMEEAPALEGKP